MDRNLFNEHDRLDDVSGAYLSEAGRLNVDFVSHYTAMLLQNCLQGERAIQMGLGNGYIAKQLYRSFKEFVVIEGSGGIIKEFQDQDENYSVVKTLFEEYTPDEKFDILFGNHVLEHVEDPQSVLEQSLGWLKDNAIAIFTVPNAHSLHRRIGVEMGLLKKPSALNENDIQMGHRRVYTIKELKADLADVGYKVKEIRGYMIKLLSNRQMKDWPRNLLDAAFKVSLTIPSELCANIAVICQK